MLLHEVLSEGIRDLDHDGSFLSYLMTTDESRCGFWILDNGDHYDIPIVGHHEEPAFSTFGERGYAAKSEREMRRQYGHLFTGWPRHTFDYNDVAMMHGWIRLILLPKKHSVAIEMMKRKVTPAAKAAIIEMIKDLDAENMHIEYVFEFNTGQDSAANNIITHDPRQAIRLLNS